MPLPTNYALMLHNGKINSPEAQSILDLGCTDVTSNTQARNGTMCFYDPLTGCKYTSHRSGYVRRMRAKGYPKQYQLNRTKTKRTHDRWGSYDRKTRILEPNWKDRLTLLAHCIQVHRNNQ